MDAFEPKLIYLARRHPSLDREQFRARWRDHARLGMSRPRWINIARYVHCDIVPPRDGLAGILGDEDAIGLIWHRSQAHRQAHLADSASRASMEADEEAVFARPIVDVCLVARETIAVPPPAGAPWKLTRFADGARGSESPPEAIGYVRNEPLPPENGAGWGLASALVEEFWFASREAAERAAPPLAEAARLLLSSEVQLYP